MFSFAQRLRTSRDIVEVRRLGKRRSHRLARIIYKPTSGKQTRATIIVSKRVAKQAIIRNTIKRRCRVLVRQQLLSIISPIDIVVIVQPPARQATVQQWREAIEQLFNKL